MGPFLSQMIPVPISKPCLFKAHFHILLLSMLSLPTGNISHNTILLNSKGLLHTDQLQDHTLSSAHNWLLNIVTVIIHYLEVLPSI